MMKLTLMDDASPIWIAPWQVVQVFSAGREGGTTIHCVGRIVSHVREAPEEIAIMVTTRGRIRA